MRRVLFLSNPVAARTSTRTAERVVRVMRDEGCSVEWVRTGCQEDTGLAARAGAQDGFDAIAVYGGDGTIMKAVAGMEGHPVPIGLIPGGTGNLLHGNLRLPRRPTAAARVVARGVPRPIDLGQLHLVDGVHRFAVACGSGLDAELMARTSGAAKRRWGFLAYVARTLELLPTARPLPFRITVDGRTFETEATALLVANCREFVPPLVRLHPDIALDDGALDLILLRATGVWEAARVVWRLLRGRIDGRTIEHVRGREIHVEAEPRRLVEFDGEVGGETPFTATVERGGLSVLVPRDSR